MVQVSGEKTLALSTIEVIRLQHCLIYCGKHETRFYLFVFGFDDGHTDTETDTPQTHKFVIYRGYLLGHQKIADSTIRAHTCVRTHIYHHIWT